MILCDGCPDAFPPDALDLFEAEGVQVRYCFECARTWVAFERAHNAEAERLQRSLELWREESRARLPLRVTPLDLPKPIRTAAAGRLVVG